MTDFREVCKGKQGAAAFDSINAQRTPAERQESARLAGIASGKSRQRQASLREAAKLFLSLDDPDPRVRAKLEALGVKPTVANALTDAMREAAHGGSVEAYKAIRDTAGERPADLKEVKLSGGLGFSEMSTEELEALLAETDDEPEAD